MSIELMDEHERGERVRTWLRDNGSALIGGVAVGLLGFFGWQWHENGKLQERYEAATQYEALRAAARENQTETAREVAQAISSQFGESPYLALADLQQAHAHVQAGDLDAAALALESARSHAKDPLLADLATLRLARLRQAQGRAEEALALANEAGKQYTGLAAELRGDILAAQGKREDAITAYQDALTHLAEGLPNRGLVELKLADLGAPSPQES